MLRVELKGQNRSGSWVQTTRKKEKEEKDNDQLQVFHHRVAMSVYVSFPCNLFWAFSVALRVPVTLLLFQICLPNYCCDAHGIGASICIGWESYCLPYAGFLLFYFNTAIWAFVKTWQFIAFICIFFWLLNIMILLLHKFSY